MDEGPVRRLRLGSHEALLPVEPSPIRHPVRLATACGAALLVAGLVLPWVNFSIDSVTDSIDGIRGETWGTSMLGVAVAMVAALSVRLIAESTHRPIQLAPAALGLAGLLVYLNINVECREIADSYRAGGYQVSFGPGLDALLAGSLICAVGGVASSAVTWRRYPPRPGPSVFAATGEWHGCADFAAELAVGAVVCIVFAIAGATLAVAVTGSSVATPSVVGVMILVGVLTGGAVTDRLWRRFVHRRQTLSSGTR
jgi:hypothetical protein